MEGEKDDIPTKDSIDDYKETLEHLKEVNDALECELQNIEELHVRVKDSIDNVNDEPVAAGVIEHSTEDVTDCVNQYMMHELSALRALKTEISRKLEEFETIFDIDNKAVIPENEANFWKMAREIAKMEELMYKKTKHFNKNECTNWVTEMLLNKKTNISE